MRSGLAPEVPDELGRLGERSAADTTPEAAEPSEPALTALPDCRLPSEAEDTCMLHKCLMPGVALNGPGWQAGTNRSSLVRGSLAAQQLGWGLSPPT